MSIATKTGDGGYTGLVGGRRVSKGDARVEAYGTIDELIAHIGLARALCGHEEAAKRGQEVQRDLFAVAEALASPQQPLKEIDSARVDHITDHIHRIEQLEGILIDWAMVGDHAGVAAFDVARTVCRRAERTAVRLRDAGEPVPASVITYLNRLADFLWLLGRLVERDAGISASLRRPDDDSRSWSKAWP
jgi:cob(I)alamin adenosyltransferase